MTDVRTPFRPRALALLVAAGAALSAGRAAAEPGRERAAPAVFASEAEAASRFQRGVVLYQEGDFAPALIEFRRAHELAPNYRVLYNIAQVHYMLGEYAEALRAFEQYLEQGGAALKAERRTAVEAEIARLRLRVGTLALTANADGVEIAIDDVPIGKTPLAAPVPVSSGRRRVVASKDGRSAVRIVEVAGGEHLEIRFDLPARPRPTEPLRPAADRGASTTPARGGASAAGPAVPLWPWAATAVLAAGAGVSGALALTTTSALTTRRETFGSTREEREALDDRRRALSLAADALAGAAVVMGGVSLYLTLARGGPAPAAERGARGSARAGRAAITLTPAGVRIQGAF
ncbi:tetratricopeptide repeat protein [Sorangium sp. So ce1036]|uniref:tetratricopeptide repeat protein n=1 Tax=Sorangium sp. So ce1036 TaxID=3133328 RepID=UPI003F0117CE